MKTQGNIVFLRSYDMTQVVLREYPETAVKGLQLFCGVCEKRSAILRWDENYVGYRGLCSLCENEWPES